MILPENINTKHKINWLKSTEPVEYGDALEIMKNLHQQVVNGELEPTIWLLEHPDTVTLGTSGKLNEVLDNNIMVHQVERGGKATYHGPGQRIIYLMLDLKKIFNEQNLDIRKFIFALESWIIKTLAEYGIEGKTYPDRIGVWVETPGRNYPHEQAKIAAIGIKISRWVSFHGIAININPDLSKFNTIIPCGLKDFAVTSLTDLNKEIELESFDQKLIENFKIVKDMLCF